MAAKRHRKTRKRTLKKIDRRRNSGLNEACQRGLQVYENSVKSWIADHVIHERGSHAKASELVEKCQNSLRRSVNKGTFGRMLKEKVQACSVRVDGQLFYANVRYVARKSKGVERSNEVTTVCLPVAGPRVELVRKQG